MLRSLGETGKQEMTVLSKIWAKICVGMRDGWKPRKILRSSTFLRLKPPPPQESAADDARSAKIIHLLWYHGMRGWWWIVWTNSWSSCSTFKHHSLPNKQPAANNVESCQSCFHHWYGHSYGWQSFQTTTWKTNQTNRESGNWPVHKWPAQINYLTTKQLKNGDSIGHSHISFSLMWCSPTPGSYH